MLRKKIVSSAISLHLTKNKLVFFKHLELIFIYENMRSSPKNPAKTIVKLIIFGNGGDTTKDEVKVVSTLVLCFCKKNVYYRYVAP